MSLKVEKMISIHRKCFPLVKGVLAVTSPRSSLLLKGSEGLDVGVRSLSGNLSFKSLRKNRAVVFGGCAFGATLMAPYVYRQLTSKSRVPAEAIYGNQVAWDAVTRKTSTSAATNPLAMKIAKDVVDKLPISREVSGPTKIQGLTFTLLQYQTCPFCCKLRAFLDYFGIPYNVVEVNPVMRQQLKFSKYRKVPILLVAKEGEDEVLQLNDSTIITSVLGSYLLHNPNLKQDIESILGLYQSLAYTRTDDNRKIDEVINRYFIMYGEHSGESNFREVEDKLSEERKWRRWTDDVLVHTLSPNIYRSLSESIDSFKYFSDVGRWKDIFAAWERMLVVYFGASAMFLISKRLKKKYALKDDVRDSLYDATRYWTKNISSKKQPYMGGNQPNLADLSVFGVLSSIEGCAAFTDLLKNTKIKSWYYDMKNKCQTHAGSAELKI